MQDAALAMDACRRFGVVCQGTVMVNAVNHGDRSAPRACLMKGRAGRAAFVSWSTLVLAVLVSGVAGAQVRWEDYRGDSRNGADYVTPLPGITDKPMFGNFDNDTSINNLRAVSANAADAVRTGTSTQINFLDTQHHLCDERAAPDGNRTGPACQHQAMGRVTYARIRFPNAGSYTLSVAHDDSVEVNMSTDYTNTAYRSASYNIPVGGLGGWSPGPNSFIGVGSFSAVAGSCALIRVYWTNQGGLNFNRLAWNGPGTGGQVVIPASAFSDPGATAPANCTGTITGSARSIALNKILGSQRVDANDQFTIEIASAASGGLLRQVTTGGSGIGQQASTGAYVLTSSSAGTYYLRETMAAGSVSTLLAYDTSIACTRNNTSFAATVVSSTATTRVWSVSMTASSAATNNQVVCSITNTARPHVTVRKTSLGTTGTFGFSGSNGIAAHNITTATPGTPVAGPRYLLTTTGAVTTITEGAPPAGFTLQGITCTGLGGGVATVDLGARTVSLNAAATALGNAIECTFTNRRLEADLSITKTNTPGVNNNVDQANDVVLSGSQTVYQIVVANAGPDAANNATLTDPPPTGMTCTSVSCGNATGGAVCPAVSIAALQGSGVTIGTFPANSTLTLTLTCTVD